MKVKPPKALGCPKPNVSLNVFSLTAYTISSVISKEEKVNVIKAKVLIDDIKTYIEY